MGQALSVLRGGRAILQRDPRSKVVMALYQAAGRGSSQDVLQALNRLDALANETYQTNIFALEDKGPAGRRQILSLIDGAIARIERQLAQPVAV